MRKAKTDSDKQRPLGSWPFWALALAGFAVVSAGLYAIAVRFFTDRLSAINLIIIVFITIVTVIGPLFSSEVIPWRQKWSWKLLKQPRIFGTLLGAVGIFYGVLSSALPLLEERGGVDAALADISMRLGRIQQGVERTKSNTEAIRDRMGIGAQSLIRRTMTGVWGELGCAMTYRFSLTDNALKVVSVDSAPGIDHYAAEFAVTSDNDIVGPGPDQSRMIATERIGFSPGMSVEFLLENDGLNQILTWTQQGQSQNSVRLVRCSN